MDKKSTGSRTKKTLSEVDKFYIENHLNSTLEDLAEATKKPKTLIQEFVDSLQNKGVDRTTVGDLIANNDRGSAVMTPNASMLADETKKERKSEKTRFTGAIHIIKEK